MNSSVILITGASSGIGLAAAKLFSEKGFRLVLIARNIESLQVLNLPNSLCFSADVVNFEKISEIVSDVEAQFGQIDCLINNAGFAKGGEFTEVSHEAHSQTMMVNVMGAMNMIEAVLPYLRERKRGTIINISSVADRSTRPLLASYAASKAALKSLSESLRCANAKFNIRICNIAPAKIRTPLLMASTLLDDQVIEAEVFAKTLLWIYEQPQSICIRDLVFAPTAYEA